MEQRRIYPVGIQDFEVVRNRGMVYVDKTAYVYRMVHDGAETVFLSRPRRFGKTLLCNTLKHFFLGHRDLFKGLAIDSLETEWTVYPVFHFDMSRCKSDNIDEVRKLINGMLMQYEAQLGISEPMDSLGGRLQNLVYEAHRQSGQKAVLIFDEYDSPVLNVIDNDKMLGEMRSLFNTFYGPVKSMYEHLRFVFITGITKFSQMSIFSSINNISNITMDAAYEGICGITADELEQYFAPDIEELATNLSCTPEQALQRLRDRYDGYHFSKRLTDVYNPFSLVNAFNKMDLGYYWFDSATPSSLIKIMDHYQFRLDDIEGGAMMESTFNQPFDNFDNPIPILTQSGYLTIKDYEWEEDVYTIGIPNKEVYDGLYNCLMARYLNKNQVANDGIQIAVWRAMRDDDIDAALRAVQSYLAALPYDLSNKTEKDYETILRVLFDGLGIKVDSEVKNATGRCDVVLKSKTTVYVLELKLDGNGTIDDALAQIDEKNYLIPYWNDPRPKVKVGVLVDPTRRTITEWRVAR